MMLWFVFWALVGALLGVAAAQRNGFSVAGGVLGGLLLGPLAIFIFLVDGVGDENTGRRTCPHCAEWVKGDAVVCKHCGRDILVTQVSRSGRCRTCGGTVTRRARTCPGCQRTVQIDHREDTRLSAAS